MGEWLPDGKPDWWSTIKNFGKDPKGFVLGFVATWVVGGFLDVGEIVIEAVQLAFEPVIEIPVTIASTLSRAVAPAAELILWIPGEIDSIFTGLTASLGPAAPLVIIPLAVLVAVALFELLKRLPYIGSALGGR